MPGIQCNLFSFKFTYSYPSFINFLYSFVYQLILMPVCNDKEGPRVGVNLLASMLLQAGCVWRFVRPPFRLKYVLIPNSVCLFFRKLYK